MSHQTTIEKLRVIAKPLQSKNLCWIDGDSNDYCPDCGQKEAAKAGQKLDGGYDAAHETEYPPHCEICGIPLSFSFCNTATALFELQYILEDMRTGPITPREAYILLAVLAEGGCDEKTLEIETLIEKGLEK